MGDAVSLRGPGCLSLALLLLSFPVAVRAETPGTVVARDARPVANAEAIAREAGAVILMAAVRPAAVSDGSWEMSVRLGSAYTKKEGTVETVLGRADGDIWSTDLQIGADLLTPWKEPVLGGRLFLGGDYRDSVSGEEERISSLVQLIAAEYRHEASARVGLEYVPRVWNRPLRVRPAAGIGVARMSADMPFRQKRKFWLTSVLGILELGFPLRMDDGWSVDFVIGGEIDYALGGERRTFPEIERVPLPLPTPTLRFDDPGYRVYAGLELRYRGLTF